MVLLECNWRLRASAIALLGVALCCVLALSLDGAGNALQVCEFSFWLAVGAPSWLASATHTAHTWHLTLFRIRKCLIFQLLDYNPPSLQRPDSLLWGLGSWWREITGQVASSRPSVTPKGSKTTSLQSVPSSKRQNFEQKTSRTAASDIGDRSSFNLARQNVDCGGAPSDTLLANILDFISKLQIMGFHLCRVDISSFILIIIVRVQ
jgi:hypothetical protein